MKLLKDIKKYLIKIISKDYRKFSSCDGYYFFQVFKNDRNEKTIKYFINIENDPSGFFALYRWVLNYLYVADIFDFKMYVNISNSSYSDIKNENIFEKFFYQPGNLTSEEMLETKNVIISSPEEISIFEKKYQKKRKLWVNYEVGNDYIEKIAIIKKKYIKLKEDIENRIQKEIDNLGINNEIIAVHYRGTDYKAGFKNHPIGLEPSDYYQYIDECLKNGYKKVFVATDDYNGLNEFINRYGKRIIFYQDVRRSKNGESVHNSCSKRENDGFLKGYEVLRDMLTLSKCNALICGNSQVTISARIEKASNNESYDYLKVINKGLYKKDLRRK